MPYISRNLTCVGANNTMMTTDGCGRRAPSMFTYGTADSITTCRASGYFNGASDQLEKGDLVMVVSYSAADWETNNTRTVSAVQNLVVLTSAAGVVDASDGSSIGIVNT